MAERRDFFKTLGLGALAMVVPKVTTFEVNKEIKTENLHVSGPQYFHFEKPISEYDRETYMRLDELVNRK